jgi:hypothetical protein
MTNKEFKFELQLPAYPISAIVSNVTRPKYYSVTSGRGRVKKLPKALEKEGYTIDLDNFYLNKAGERVISNTKKVGKPGTIPINAQVFYVGKPFQRMAIKNFLTTYLTPFVKKMEKIDYPVYIESEVHAPFEHRLMDMNNIGYVWDKILTDIMVTEKILVDDSPLHITRPGSAPLYCPVDNFEDRKIVFKFYRDTRKEIELLRLRQLKLKL